MIFATLWFTLAGLVFVAWFAGLIALGIKAADEESWLLGGLTVITLVLPIAFITALVFQYDERQPLCRRGHEAYEQVFNGKTTSTERRWVCEDR